MSFLEENIVEDIVNIKYPNRIFRPKLFVGYKEFFSTIKKINISNIIYHLLLNKKTTTFNTPNNTIFIIKENNK